MAPALREVLVRADALLRQREAREARDMLKRFADANDTAATSAEFHAMLAQARLQDGDGCGAVEAIDRALALRPQWADAHQIRALGLRAIGALDEALHAIESALRARPHDARALSTLGSLELRRGNLCEAEIALRQAIAIAPSHELGWSTLAETLQAQGRDDEAIDAWRHWLALDPDSAHNRARFGWALAKSHRWTEAENTLSAAAESPDGDAVTAIRLAFVRRERGDAQGALSAYDRATTLAPELLTPRFGSALMLPQVYADADDLDRWRARYARGLNDLTSELTRQEPGPAQFWRLDWSNFYLGYQGQDDLALQRSYAGIVGMLAAKAAPQWAPEQKPPGSGRSRLRVGFASSYFRTSTVGSYFGAWLTGLDKTRFEVQAFSYGHEFDATTEWIRANTERFVRTSPDARQIASTIHAADLDILIYPQLGMDGRDATLAALRLAPVQCAAWGHPETTGSEAIDYFFSCEQMEPAEASRHYSERLLLLPGLGTRYSLLGTRSADRSEFGLPDTGRLYVCPHSLFKIHPDNDSMFADLLVRDALARLVFCADSTQPVTTQFMSRLRRRLQSSDVQMDERVMVQPLRPPSEFRAMLSVCDVMIDTLHWSGGNTSLDALAAGLPIVSCAGHLMRGRQSAAMLRTLGLDMLVAATPADAVAKAIGAAADAGNLLRDRIVKERGALFDRHEPIAALAEHLIRIRG